MQPKTIEIINGDCRATVTVRAEDGFAAIDRMTAEVSLEVYATTDDGDLKISSRDWGRRKQFAAAWSQSEVVGDLGFEWCESPFDAEGMLACYLAWGKLPGECVLQWLNAVNAVDQLPNDPDLLPPELLSQKKETIP